MGENGRPVLCRGGCQALTRWLRKGMCQRAAGTSPAPGLTRRHNGSIPPAAMHCCPPPSIKNKHLQAAKRRMQQSLNEGKALFC